jgi:hypothetical protein
LRNAHIPSTVAVYVGAEFVCSDGKVRHLRRTLVTDYDGNTSCVSKLELDGTVCAETEIESQIGLRLLHPPLRAPVLAQHTLGYVFTASPTDRAAYFRAVLDTQDLEDFRAAVAGLVSQIAAPDRPELSDLAAVEGVPELAPDLKAIRDAKSNAALDKALSSALEALLAAIGVTPKSTFAERIAQLAEALDNRRKLAFPLDLFGRKPLNGWNEFGERLPDHVTTFDRERGAIAEEIRRLVALFESALAIPAIHECEYPIDCPLCGAVKSLTPDRVAHIQKQLAANSEYQEAEKALLRELEAIDSRSQTFMDSAAQSLPRFMQISGAERRRHGFKIERVRTLSGDAPATARWVTASRSLWRTMAAFRRIAQEIRALVKVALHDIGTWTESSVLLDRVERLKQSYDALEGAHANYTSAVQSVGQAVKGAVDQNAQTGGWEELIRLATNTSPLFGALTLHRLHAAKIKAIEQALKEIDAGNGKVADEKFGDLSVEVSKWWERLRPGEPTFFNSVRRRSAKARRTVDLKVTLTAKEDRSDPKLRDAVAVFSQSQLHCLGLSLFLARAIDGGAGFVLLDDPVLTSDDDFRPNFASTVIEALLDAGLQVIVLTQDYKSWKDIGHRWDHRGAAQFQMVRDNAVAGTEIRGQDDALAAMLVQAQPFIHSQDGDQRKNGATRLRQAIERFCKELLVKSRRANGDNLAMITNYDGKNFGDFSAQIHGMLTLDPSHKGKLTAAHSYVTPGPHDDTPPSTAQLKMAAGDIKRLKKDYLD